MRVRPDAGSERGRIHGAELTLYSQNPRGEQLPDFKRGGQHASAPYSEQTVTRISSWASLGEPQPDSIGTLRKVTDISVKENGPDIWRCRAHSAEKPSNSFAYVVDTAAVVCEALMAASCASCSSVTILVGLGR